MVGAKSAEKPFSIESEFKSPSAMLDNNNNEFVLDVDTSKKIHVYNDDKNYC